jgi:hypothetical protein
LRHSKINQISDRPGWRADDRLHRRSRLHRWAPMLGSRMLAEADVAARGDCASAVLLWNC